MEPEPVQNSSAVAASAGGKQAFSTAATAAKSAIVAVLIFINNLLFPIYFLSIIQAIAACRNRQPSGLCPLNLWIEAGPIGHAEAVIELGQALLDGENEGTALIFLNEPYTTGRSASAGLRTLNQPQVLRQFLGPVRFLAHDTGDEPVGTGPEDIADPLPPFGTHFPAGAEPDDIGRQISQEQVQAG